MKINPSLLYITTIPVAFVVISLGCKPSEPTSAEITERNLNRQVENARTATRDATLKHDEYTFAQRTEFIAAMEMQIEKLNQSLDQLSSNIENASQEVQEEARPKLEALRNQADLLNDELENAKTATASNWNNVKAKTREIYDGMIVGFQDARQWVSDQIEP